MVLETERLILRRYRQGDLQDLYEYLSDEDVVKYEPYRPMDLEETKKELALRIADEEMIAVERKQNPNSWRLLERLSFAKEAHFRQYICFWKDETGKPLWKDTFVYSILNV